MDQCLPSRRGRPLVSDEATIPPFRKDASNEEKYLRMRLLNNQASRRCRTKRKTKMNMVENELKKLEDMNRSLVQNVEHLEQLIESWSRLVREKCGTKI